MLINIIQKLKTDQSYNSEEGGSWYLPIHQLDNVPIIDNIPPAFALLKFLSINEGILKKWIHSNQSKLVRVAKNLRKPQTTELFSKFTSFADQTSDRV